MEAILLEPMYEIPGMTDVDKVVVSKDVVEGKAKPVMVHGAPRGKAADASA
jgi:ATP-dependent Clp protease ATP-binding subunit ClpX